MEQSLQIQGITKIILDDLEERKLSDREWAKSIGITHPMVGKFRTGTSMGIDLLETIITVYPEIKAKIIEYLGGNTEKKPTPATNTDEAAIRAELVRLRNDNLVLKRLVTEQTSFIQHFVGSKMVEQG